MHDQISKPTEVMTFEEQSGSALSQETPLIGRYTFKDLYRIAKMVVLSKMAPYGMDTVEKCMVAMMYGHELELAPMQSIQSIAVINNRPCLYGDGLMAIVRASQHCEYMKEWIEGEGDARVGICETKRRNEVDPVRRTFSAADAKRAGLWQTEAVVERRNKSGGTYQKDNDSPWFKYPDRMLQMRARAFCLRDVYPDVIKGFGVAEEVADSTPRGFDNARDVTPAQVTEKYQQNAKDNTVQTGGFNPDGINAAIEEAEGEVVETPETVNETQESSTGQVEKVEDTPDEIAAEDQPQGGPSSSGAGSAALDTPPLDAAESTLAADQKHSLNGYYMVLFDCLGRKDWDTKRKFAEATIIKDKFKEAHNLTADTDSALANTAKDIWFAFYGIIMDGKDEAEARKSVGEMLA